MYNPNQTYKRFYPQSYRRPNLTYRNNEVFLNPNENNNMYTVPENNLLKYKYPQYGIQPTPPPVSLPHEQQQQQQQSEEEKQPLKLYGIGCRFNFGKYYDLTVYGVANNGDFSYLKWLNKGNFKGDFKLSEEFKEHVATSIGGEKQKNKWEQKDDETSYWYELLADDGQIIKSPSIKKFAVIYDNLC